MNLVYLALGSNLQNPAQQLADAVEEIATTKGITLLHQSSVYQTAPIGPEQPDFLNMALAIETNLTPLALLNALQSIEENHHRERTIYWGPRTLDIDILLYNDQIIIEGQQLIVPHPRMHERGFVLVPLKEIAPNLILPNSMKSIDHHLKTIDLTDIQRLETPHEASTISQ